MLARPRGQGWPEPPAGGGSGRWDIPRRGSRTAEPSPAAARGAPAVEPRPRRATVVRRGSRRDARLLGPDRAAPGCTTTEAGPRQRPQATSWPGRDGAREAAACLRARVAAAAAPGPSVPARLQVASRLRGCWPRAARVVVGRGLPRVAHAGARIDLFARGRRGCSWTAFAQCDFHCGRRYDNVFTLVRWRSRPPSWCSDAYKGLRTEETRVVGKGQQTFAVDRLHRRRETESIDA